MHLLGVAGVCCLGTGKAGDKNWEEATWRGMLAQLVLTLLADVALCSRRRRPCRTEEDESEACYQGYGLLY